MVLIFTIVQLAIVISLYQCYLGFFKLYKWLGFFLQIWKIINQFFLFIFSSNIFLLFPLAIQLNMCQAKRLSNKSLFTLLSFKLYKL